MTAALEHVREAAENRAAAESTFREALRAAAELHSLREIGEAAGLSKGGVKYLLEREEK